MAIALLSLSLLTLVIWLGLWLANGSFWCIDREPLPPAPPDWPALLAVIPARNEADGIAATLRSLWEQDYPGDLHVVLVDDESDDGTAEIAREAAREYGQEVRLRIVSAPPRSPEWTGKVWAMHQGLRHGLPSNDSVTYVLFSDADITHGPGALRELVCRAEAGKCDLASFMVRLQCRTLPERLMIPAFVFFFRMLYPFRRINNPAHPLAGAAGGTMLVRRTALKRIGGLTAIQGELIDDCSLARAIKQGRHRLWVGLSETSASTRSYWHLREILQMIARTAYTQLGYSPLRLLGCILGLTLTFLAPPFLLLFASGWTAAIGGFVWLLMSLLYLPMIRFYRLSPLWAPLLPFTALLYLWATLFSAWNYHRGKGGQWKGRSQSPVGQGRGEREEGRG